MNVYENAAIKAGWVKQSFGEAIKWWNPAKDDGSRYLDKESSLRALCEDHNLAVETQGTATMFEFISSYQGEFHYRKIGDTSGNRYRVNANLDNRLTIGFMRPTESELAEFQAWQRAELDRQQLEMLANPRKYPREFWHVKNDPILLATMPPVQLVESAQ